MRMTIRDFIRRDFGREIKVTGGCDGKWMSIYRGPVELTSDGVARWSANGVLDLPIDVKDGVATVVCDDDTIDGDDICSLFNTISGQVNKFTRRKYVVEADSDKVASCALELLRIACDLSGLRDERL